MTTISTKRIDQIARRAKTFLDRDAPHQARQVLDRAVREHGEHPQLLNLRAECCREIGEPLEALDTWTRVLEVGGSEEAFYSLLEVAHEISGVDAGTYFDEYETLIPSSRRKQRYALRTGRFDGAIDELTVRIVAYSDLAQDDRQLKFWGDYWFKSRLASALENSGLTVDDEVDTPDVLLHLFGGPYTSSWEEVDEGTFRIVWIHSHPDWLRPENLERYDRIFCVSPLFAERIRSWGFDAEVLIGATPYGPSDGSEEVDENPGAVFVGNGRTGGRPALLYAQEADEQVAVWGSQWDEYVPDSWIRGAYYPNEDLGALYASSAVVLNDHHVDMRAEGFVNPRVLEALSVGTHVLTDEVRGMPDDIRELATVYTDAEDFERKLRRLVSGEVPPIARQDAARIAEKYSFRRVKDVILEDLLGERTEPDGPRQAAGDGTIRNGSSRVAVRDGKRNRTVESENSAECSERAAYLVMGMHRSGTSLVTQLVHRLGPHAGSTLDHLRPAADNPRGFWELENLKKLNELVLQAANGSWVEPPPANALDRVALDPLAETVLDYFPGRVPWVAKDPRLCLTFPVLERVLPDDLGIIAVNRDPEAVASSLEARNGLPREWSRTLHQEYTRRRDLYTAGYPTVTVSFDGLFDDRREEQLERLRAFLGSEVDALSVFRLIVDRSLKHH